MPTENQLRTGLCFIEIGMDQAYLKAECEAAKAQVAKLAADIGKTTTGGGRAGGFFAGSMRSVDLFGTGMQLFTVISSAQAAFSLLNSYGAIFRGDMEGAQKAIETMPLGLGALAKEMRPQTDWLSARIAEWVNIVQMIPRSVLQGTVVEQGKAEAIALGIIEGPTDPTVKANPEKRRKELALLATKFQLLGKAHEELLKAEVGEEAYTRLQAERAGIGGEDLKRYLDEVARTKDLVKRKEEAKRIETEINALKIEAIRLTRGDAAAFEEKLRLEGRSGLEVKKLIVANEKVLEIHKQQAEVKRQEEAFDEAMKQGQEELDAADKSMTQQLRAAGNLEDLWRNEHKSNAAFQSVTELQRQVMIAGAGTTRDPTIEELKELNAREQAKAERADRWHREIVAALGQIGKPQ